jgi:Fur family ferric uptake transcriptional regulator
MDENVRTVLREKGMKVTPKRLAVADLFRPLRGSMTPEMVWKRLRPKLGALGLPTVYRILEDLVRAGILTRIELADRVLRYAACRAEPGVHHHHLVCVRCGTVSEVEDCAFERHVRGVERRTGFRVTGHRLHVEGLCSKCRQRGRQ